VALALAGGAGWYWLQHRDAVPLASSATSPATKAANRDAPLAGSPAVVEVTVGSTPEEQQAAYALCQQVAGNGCELEDYADERIRKETITPVRLDEHEVTNRDFAAFATATRAMTAAERQGFSYMPVAGGLLAKGTNLSWRAPTPDVGYRDRLDHPVVHVSLEDAQAYCQAQGKRLPTEAEWEYAARGKERQVFPWGSEWSQDRAVWKTTGTEPVGSRPAGESPEGLQDLAGNVWEWTTTEAPGDSGELFLKGGSWASSDPAQLRGAMHMRAVPTDTSADVGFRCAADR
jgi:sulfatase modifying factor 1